MPKPTDLFSRLQRNARAPFPAYAAAPAPRSTTGAAPVSPAHVQAATAAVAQIVSHNLRRAGGAQPQATNTPPASTILTPAIGQVPNQSSLPVHPHPRGASMVRELRSGLPFVQRNSPPPDRTATPPRTRAVLRAKVQVIGPRPTSSVHPMVLQFRHGPHHLGPPGATDPRASHVATFSPGPSTVASPRPGGAPNAGARMISTGAIYYPNTAKGR